MSTLTVGAAGAGGVFDYTCDGTADHVEINAALAAAGAGDTVQLSAGTFNCSGHVNVAAGVSLAGAGADATTIHYPGLRSGETVTALAIRPLGGNTISDFTHTGGTWINIEGDDVAVERVTSRQSYAGITTNKGIAAFRVVIPEGGTRSNVTIEDCHAIDTDASGFVVGYSVTNGAATDITFRDCTATGCGLGANRYNEFVVGFDPAEGQEGCTFTRITVEDCTATDCYESGIHAEFAGNHVDSVIRRCTATGCGLTKSPAIYGAGILCGMGWTVEDCTSTNNALFGYYCGGSDVNAHVGKTMTLSRLTATDNPDGYGIWVGGGAGREITGLTMDGCTVAGSGAVKAPIYLNYVAGATVADVRLVDCPLPLAEAYCSGNTITYYLAPFAASPGSPVTGEAVAFTETSDNDGLAAWSWSFGDGSGSSAQHPTHAYPAAGVYPVTLTAGGNTVTQTIAVVPGVSYGGARLSEADLGPLDHDPVAIATRTKVGSVRLQGSPVSRRAWTIDALADDRAEIEALAALKGQHLTLNINGVEYPGVMIRPPMLEVQLTPSAWAYQIGLVQETRR